MLLTTAPTSSMNSSEAPVMTGGTVEDTGLQSRRVSASEDLDQVQRNVCVFLPRTSRSKCSWSSPASLTA